MRAPGSRAAAVGLLLAAAVSAAAPDALWLQPLQNNEESIDGLISSILMSPKNKVPTPERQRPGLTPTIGHSPRPFAYYPSDPEYRAPRRSAGHAAPRALAGVTDKVNIGQGFGVGAGNGAIGPPLPVPSESSNASTEEYRDAMGDAREEARYKRLLSGSDQEAPAQPAALHGSRIVRNKISDVIFIVAVVGACASVVCVTILGGFCYRYLQRRYIRTTSDSEFPSYGVTGPHRDVSPSADRKLAQSAQMYHFQHQKQQMMAIQEGRALGRREGSPSDTDSDEESEHTVYECPGLAPSGEMEVKNPLFNDDPTPSQSGGDNSDP